MPWEVSMVVEPKFYQNWEDDSHCLQSSVMIVLNTLNRKVTWDEVNKMTDYEDGLYSWVPRAVVALAERIPGTRHISVMDYGKFAEKGEEYLKEFMPGEWFEDQKRNASVGFQKEQKAAQDLIQKNLLEQKVRFTKEDFESLLDKHLLIALVNGKKLAQLEGNVGHFVVVYGQDEENFIIHDPGLPAREAWKAQKDLFLHAFQGELILVPKGDVPIGVEVSRNDPCLCGSGKKYKKCHGK
ncbi:MAG: Protein translocase subunit SecA [Parcubacteria group bacterium GW2011_GWA1_49_26]|uniref:Protein translocase subunit SecA n=2 Tax=Parcubacteria group TaxID=1794811 RepID=A0A837IL55_9BACT|nr:MAG: Protein translocase subunit SecA [Candidatus Yanofskybacteria bacterium GW2011_GWC1_48_11]KKW08397.1 MAG: Protein translocase subunit SecA [Parcubacteria group bacterium GW2011_GWA1_49_26]